MVVGLMLAAAAACAGIEGGVAAWRAETRLVLVGETHGTREAPGVAAALLCEGQRRGRRPLLALEAPPAANQASVDAYLASAGTPADREALRAAPMWADIHARGSEAVLDLVETARATGAAVVLYDTVPARSGATDSGREQGMAVALAAAAARGPVVVLTGLGHADRTGFTSMTPFVASAAGRLPQDAIVTLAPIPSGGEAWGCRRPSPEAASVCKAWPVAVRRPAGPPAIVWDKALREGFDGGYSVGPFTASPPARR